MHLQHGNNKPDKYIWLKTGPSVGSLFLLDICDPDSQGLMWSGG